MARLEPLSLREVEGLEEVERTVSRTLGFVPNGLRIHGMERTTRLVVPGSGEGPARPTVLAG